MRACRNDFPGVDRQTSDYLVLDVKADEEEMIKAIAELRSLEQLTFWPFPFKAATSAGIMQLQTLSELKKIQVEHLELTISGDLKEVLSVVAEAQEARDRTIIERAPHKTELPNGAQ
jgi:hypothetical protein